MLGDEKGVTLIELMIAMLLSSILIGVATVFLSTFFKTENNVNGTYKNLNQILPVSTTFQRLLRSAVSPAPTQPGQSPTPPFGVYATQREEGTTITDSSLTFFTNTGTPNGPTKVVARVLMTINDLGERAWGNTLTVWLIPPMANTCPRATTTSIHHCAWTTARKKQLFRVDGVFNAPPSASMFTYFLTPTNPNTPPQKISEPPATEFATCTPTACPAGHIESISVNLKVSTTNSAINKSNQADDENLTYAMSATSQAYSPEVG